MVQGDRRSLLLSELNSLRERVDRLKRENSDLGALIEQIIVENNDLKILVRERLETTQMLRDLL
ncbi:hypothetical protein ES703_15652 [subsurface metagenome]